MRARESRPGLASEPAPKESRTATTTRLQFQGAVTPDVTIRCVTCGAYETPSRSGNCRRTQDRAPVFLPQTDVAEIAQRFAVKLDAEERITDAREAAAFAKMAARIRRMANSPTHAELVQRRAG